MGRRREIYFEFFVLANQVKVSAIDGDTGIEVSVIAPQSASEDDMKQVALAKLERRLAQESDNQNQSTSPRSGTSGRGI